MCTLANHRAHVVDRLVQNVSVRQLPTTYTSKQFVWNSVFPIIGAYSNHVAHCQIKLTKQTPQLMRQNVYVWKCSIISRSVSLLKECTPRTCKSVQVVIVAKDTIFVYARKPNFIDISKQNASALVPKCLYIAK